MTQKRRILVTGATGYIGGSLAPHLLKAGYPVRVMVRNPDRLRGRWWADQVEVAVGDAVDFMRAEAVEPGHLLRLYLEAKMPGRLWMQFEAHPAEENGTRLVQTVFFDSRGLLGVLYWRIFHWLHVRVFSGLTREIARQAEGSCRP